MSARYAEHTDVSMEKSKAEIEATLRRYGATAFAHGWNATEAVIGFEIAHRQIRMHLPLPDRKDKRFTEIQINQSKYHVRQATREQAEKRWEQACRQSWRALALVIKAKLEAVAAGITTVEQEFLAHIVLPNGSTVGDWARPQLAAVYEQNKMPALMPGVGHG
jgi:hypothetical protein